MSVTADSSSANAGAVFVAGTACVGVAIVAHFTIFECPISAHGRIWLVTRAGLRARCSAVFVALATGIVGAIVAYFASGFVDVAVATSNFCAVVVTSGGFTGGVTFFIAVNGAVAALGAVV